MNTTYTLYYEGNEFGIIKKNPGIKSRLHHLVGPLSLGDSDPSSV